MGFTLELGDPKPSLRCADCGGEVEIIYGFCLQQRRPARRVPRRLLPCPITTRELVCAFWLGTGRRRLTPNPQGPHFLVSRSEQRASTTSSCLSGPTGPHAASTALAGPTLTHEPRPGASVSSREVFHIAEVHIIHGEDGPACSSSL